MKKRLFTLLLIACTFALSLNIGAMELEDVEKTQAEETSIEESAAALSAITESDRPQFAPAEKYGNLIGNISFDAQNAVRDAVSYAPGLDSISTGANCTFSYAADPTGVRSGYVLDMTNTDALHRIAITLFDSQNTNSLKVGRYTLTFDAYTSTETPKDSFFRFDLGSASVYFNDAAFANRGKWATYSLTLDVTAVHEDGTVDALVNGSATSLDAKPTINVWFQKTVGSHVYFDDIRLYEFPKERAVWIDHLGNRVLYDISKMTKIPLPSELIPNSNDDESFYVWKDEEGVLYKAGDVVDGKGLEYKTLTGVTKSYVYFYLDNAEASLYEFTKIPYPSEVNVSWSDEGFYAWEDQDGTYYRPGETKAAVDMADFEMTAVKTADYNQTLSGTKLDENGILLYRFSFDTASEPFQPWQTGYCADYRDVDHTSSDTEIYVFRVTADSSWQVVEDDTGAQRGKLLKGTTNGVDRLAVNAKVTAGAGIYTVKADMYTTSPYTRIDFSEGTMVRQDGANAWKTVSASVKASKAIDFSGIYVTLGAGAYTHYIDELRYYYAPENGVYFDNAKGAQAVYYGGADGKVVIPVPSAVCADWTDVGFSGWTATSGKVYLAGDIVLVSELAGEVLKNEVQSVTFKLGEATDTLVDISTIPYPSEVNASWSDDGFYAWKLGESLYCPGESGNSALLGKTLVAVTSAEHNAALGNKKADEKGLLLLAADFSNEQTAYSYIHSGFMTSGTIGGTNAEVTDDPTSSGRGKLLHVGSATGGHVATFGFSGKVGAGKVTYCFDSYETGVTYLTKQNDFSTSDTTPYPTNIQNTWYAHRKSFEVKKASQELTYYNIWGGSGAETGELYIDNFELYYKPDNAVIFINNDSGAAYTARSDGTLVLPKPSGVHAGWSNDDFYAWLSSDGTFLKAGATIRVSDFDGKTLTAMTCADNAPLTLDRFSIRTNGVSGMRAASFIHNAARNASSEYGYIVSRKSFFKSVEYDYGTYLVFPAGYDTQTGSGMLASVDRMFVSGISYKPESDIDFIYSTDGSVFGENVGFEKAYPGGGVYFTCVLTGMNSYQAYHEDIVLRPYIKLDGKYYYGKTVEANLYELAVKYQKEHGTGNSFVDKIVSASMD